MIDWFADQELFARRLPEPGLVYLALSTEYKPSDDDILQPTAPFAVIERGSRRGEVLQSERKLAVVEAAYLMVYQEPLRLAAFRT